MEAFLPMGLSFHRLTFILPLWAEEAEGKRDICCCLQLLFFPQKSSANPQSTSHWFLTCLVNCKHDQHQGQAAEVGLTPHVFIKESQCSFTPEILMW